MLLRQFDSLQRVCGLFGAIQLRLEAHIEFEQAKKEIELIFIGKVQKDGD